MSVISDHTDDLINEFNELESKVFVLIEMVKGMEKRIKTIEHMAKKHGIDLEKEQVEADTCTIN